MKLDPERRVAVTMVAGRGYVNNILDHNLVINNDWHSLDLTSAHNAHQSCRWRQRYETLLHTY